MDKRSFYDIDYRPKRPAKAEVVDNSDSTPSPRVSVEVVATEAPRQIIQGENIMADVDTGLLASDIRAAEANIRDKVGAEACLINKNIGDTGHRLEKSLGDNRYTIANEANAIQKHIGDTRQEDAENFGHTRRDIMAAESTLAREIGAAESDIRREAGVNTNEIVRETLKGDYNTLANLKDVRFDLATSIDRTGDRMVDRLTEHDMKVSDRFFTVGRDLADVRQGQATLAKDVEVNALKTQLDLAKQTTYLSDKIDDGNERTRALINDLKYHDLNRGLVERNAALVECEAERRDWRYRADQNQFQGQWASLQSQLQAFASQLQETRQGVTNFGTMTGNAGRQQSTSNNA